MEEDLREKTATGRVKWFDPVRGFGFVVVDDLESDVLLHVNVLREFGQSSVPDGAAVTLRLQQSDRGLQATEVLTIEAPDGETAAVAGPDVEPIDPSLPFLPARVKWFDKGKGFGFVNAFGSREDVFVHVDVLRRFGLADLMVGEAVCIREAEGARGRLAVEVRRWEHYEA
jgi:CspA family cold shock protein